MSYLSAIINAVETRFQIKIHGEYYYKTLINGIRFISEEDMALSHLSPNILYLAEYRKFSGGELFGDLLYVGCGDEIPGRKAMYIKETLDIFEVYNTIAECLLVNERIQQKKDSLFRILHDGKGIDKLLRAAYSELNNPISVLDSSYSTLAFYPDIDEPMFELRDGRLSLNNTWMSDMKQKNITEHIYHSVYPFRTLTTNFPYEFIFESIRINHSVVGYVCVRCLNRPVTDNELDLIHALTQMISIQLQKNDSYQNPYSVKYEMFFKRLFMHHLDTEDSARRHLGFLNVKPKQDYYMIASGFPDIKTKLMANDYYCRQLMSIFQNSITGFLEDNFVTLISTDNFPYFTSAVMDRFESFLTMNHMKAAVSYVFNRLVEGEHYYEQCRSQLSYLLATYSESPIGFYKDYYLRHMVQRSSDYDALNASIHPAVKHISEYDREYHTDYLETLTAYFQQNRSIPATAKALFIHKSTLFYRMNKIKTLFQMDFDDKDELFSYEYSLYMMDILKNKRE